MSLLRYVLNSDAGTIYENNRNHRLNEVSVEGALRRSAVAEFDQQAFLSTGNGYQAFILSYESTGLDATTGRQNESGTSESAPPLGGVLGKLGEYYALRSPNVDYTTDLEVQQAALSQINYFNNIRAKVWIPSIDIMDVPQMIQNTVSESPRLKDRELYQTCHVVDEQHLQSLPPPGSLVTVDYSDRRSRIGLTLKSVVCTDANFARIIMAEFAGVADVEHLGEFFQNMSSTQDAFNFSNGDAISAIRPTPAMTSSEIEDLADNYHEDTTIPGHGPSGGQHASFLTAMHPDMVPYAKAFMYKAWNDRSITITINSVYRSPTQQQALIQEWEQGTRAIKPGTTSYHLLGMALDFNPTLQTGMTIRSTDSPTTWASSGIVSIGESVNLYWGGRFGRNYDPIHFDFRNIISTSQKNILLEQSQQLAVAPNRISTSIVV